MYYFVTTSVATQLRSTYQISSQYKAMTLENQTHTHYVIHILNILMVEILSIINEIGLHISTFNSLSKDSSHRAWHIAQLPKIYFSSHEDNVITLCFFELHAIEDFMNLKIYHDVLLLSLLSPHKSEFEYPFRSSSHCFMFLANRIPCSSVPWTYLMILLLISSEYA